MDMDDIVRVLVVDDHAGIRAGIASLICSEQPRMCCVGMAATAREALRLAQETRPDVVLLDVDLDGEDGLALIPALRRATPCSVLVLTSLSDPHVALAAARQGAQACLSKSAPADELLSAILRTMPVPNARLPTTSPFSEKARPMPHSAPGPPGPRSPQKTPPLTGVRQVNTFLNPTLLS